MVPAVSTDCTGWFKWPFCAQVNTYDVSRRLDGVTLGVNRETRSRFMAPRISHICIRCGDLRDSLSFYRDILGLEEFMRLEIEGKQVVILRADSINVELTQASPTEEPLQAEGHRGLNHFGFLVRNINEMVTDLKEKGINILSEPREVQKGAWAAFIEDPGGVRTELVQLTR